MGVHVTIPEHDRDREIHASACFSSLYLRVGPLAGVLWKDPIHRFKEPWQCHPSSIDSPTTRDPMEFHLARRRFRLLVPLLNVTQPIEHAPVCSSRLLRCEFPPSPSSLALARDKQQGATVGTTSRSVVNAV